MTEAEPGFPGSEGSLHPLIGHSGIREPLARAVLRDTLPSTLLLHGPEGIGKQRLGLWLSQALLCDGPGAAGGCGRCASCRMSVRLEHPDLYWLPPLPRPKGASSPERLESALEEARLAWIADARANPIRVRGLPDEEGRPRALHLQSVLHLRKEALKRPVLGARRTFLVGEAHLLSSASGDEAANAFLKLLEEPPPHAFFILTSSEVAGVLPTLRSRSVPVALSPLPRTLVRDWLLQVAGADPGAADRAANLSRGSPGRAVGFLPPPGEAPDARGPLDELRIRAFELLRIALDGPPAARLAPGLELAAGGARELAPLLHALHEWIRDLAVVAAGSPDSVLNAEAASWLARAAERHRIDPLRVDRARGILDATHRMASGNVNPQLLIPGLLLELSAALTDAPAPS